MNLRAAPRKSVSERRLVIEGRAARFMDRTGIDAEALAFEAALARCVELPLPQRLAYVQASRGEFRIFQLSGLDGQPSCQIILQIQRPARLQGLGRAFAPRAAAGVGYALRSNDEIIALGMLRRLCAENGDIITLRLQPHRSSPAALDAFQERARVAGYESAAPLDYVRTLRYDLTAPEAERIARLSKKTRAKIRKADRAGFEIRPLTDPRFIPACRAAQAASFARSGGEPAAFDFEAAFRLAASDPGRVAILGFFLAEAPQDLLAYVIGFRGESAAEYVSAGSLSDERLRQHSFNYSLIWELAAWAQARGAVSLDLGGITAGGEDDPRARISKFKRHLSEDEVEIGREVVATLQPLRTLLLDRLIQLKKARQGRPLRLVGGLLAALAIFAGALGGAAATGRLGSPDSPAWARLRDTARMPEIAIIGDSRPHTGLSPRVLVEELARQGLPGLDAHNFAVDGTDVVHHYSFAAHGLLEGWAVPPLLIWAPNPLQFSENRRSNRLEQLPIHDLPTLARAGAPLELLLDLATMALFPPYRDRPLLTQRIFEDYAGRAAARALPLQQRVLRLDVEREPVSRRYTERPDGQESFEILDWKDRFERGARAYERDYDALRLSDWHFEMARQLMVRARDAGARLLVLEMPVAPYFQKHLATRPVHLAWRRRLRALADAQGAIFMSHADAYAAPGDDMKFGDPGHMPAATAEEYNRRLAREIARDGRIAEALRNHRRR